MQVRSETQAEFDRYITVSLLGAGGKSSMTEAELITAFQGYLGEINAVLFGYISFISGFLIMSYLVASKLSNLLSIIVLALFTTASGVLILRLLFLRNDFSSLYQYILQQIQAGKLELPWIGSNRAVSFPVNETVQN
jgi:hypothetical protein